MKIELFPSLGPHCAAKARRSRAPVAAAPLHGNYRGLQEAPEQKRPLSLWQKLKHSFDYGNTGDNG